MILLGKRLKELRENAGLTQRELGEKVNVTKVSICCYEKGARSPSLDTLIDLANVFNVNADYLLGNDVYVVREGVESYGTKISKEEMEFIQIIKKNEKLHDMLLKDPKRFIELMDKKLK